MARLYSRITMIHPDGMTETVYLKRGRKKKKVSAPLRPLERVHFHGLKAADRAAGEMLGRYRRSRTKRRDGWLRDMPKNVMKANRKALKQLNKI